MQEERTIECIAKENYIRYQDSIRDNQHNFRNKTIVIFGAGIIGLQFSYLLESASFVDYLFCDNDKEKQGTKIRGHEVISALRLKDNKDQYYVFLAMERYKDCEKQLLEWGYEATKDWYNLKNVSEEQLINDFIGATQKEEIMFCDCVATNISIIENDKVSLRDLLMKESNVQVLGLNGLYMRSFYMLLQMLWNCNKKIKRVALLLDISIFYEKYPLFPKNQHEDLILKLKDISGLDNEEMMDYINTIESRANSNRNFYMVSPERTKLLSPEQIEQGRMMHMRLNQMFHLREETESVEYLRLFLEFCRLKGIQASVIVFPVNYQLGELYFRERFKVKYGAICDGIKKYVLAEEATWQDLSYLLPKEDFITIRSVGEGIRMQGRIKIANAVKRIDSCE